MIHVIQFPIFFRVASLAVDAPEEYEHEFSCKVHVMDAWKRNSQFCHESIWSLVLSQMILPLKSNHEIFAYLQFTKSENVPTKKTKTKQ